MSDLASHSADRFDALLEALLDHQLSDAEWSELRATLISDPKAMDRYLDFVTLHALLEVEVGWHQAIQNREVDLFADADPLAGTTPSLNDAMILPAIREDPADRGLPEEVLLPKALPVQMKVAGGEKMKFRSTRLLAASLLLAASVAIAVTLVTLRHRARSSELTTLTHTLAARWDASSRQPSAGDALPVNEELSLAAGWAELTYPNGVVVTIEGPARFSMKSGKFLSLDSGKLTAIIPEAGRGFTVATASAVIVDLGTEFGVESFEDGKSDVQVFRGRVTVAPAAGGQNQPAAPAPLELKAGDARRVQADGAMAPIQLAESTFVRPQQLTAWIHADQASPYERWKASAERLRRDPDLLGYYTFDKDTDRPSLLINTAASHRASDGTIERARWDHGRFPGKSSLSFAAPDERVDLTVPGQFKGLTLWAWLRTQGSPRPYNAIVAALDSDEKVATGQLHHWSLLGDGRLGLAFKTSSPTAQDQWDIWQSTAPAIDWRASHWVLLTCTIDNDAVRFYSDGAPIGEPVKPVGPGSSGQPRNITVGEIQIGNFTEPPLDEFAPRNFRGSVDEFGILARVMSEQEIKRLYEAGKPYGSS